MKNILKCWMFVATLLVTACNGDDPDPIQPIAISFSQASITIEEGKTGEVTITSGVAPYAVSPANATVATARVNGNTITITAIAAGSTQIRVVGKDGGSGTVSLTVSADPLKAFKADATLRWELSTQTIKNTDSKHLFYKDLGKLLSSSKSKLGYGDRNGSVFVFVEWEGAVSLGAKQNATLRTESGVVPLSTLDIVQLKDGLIWLIAKEGSKEIRIVQKW